jgi:hypothetical protein
VRDDDRGALALDRDVSLGAVMDGGCGCAFGDRGMMDRFSIVHKSMRTLSQLTYWPPCGLLMMSEVGWMGERMEFSIKIMERWA